MIQTPNSYSYKKPAARGFLVTGFIIRENDDMKSISFGMNYITRLGGESEKIAACTAQEYESCAADRKFTDQ